jgi:hypothetical protein
LPENTAGRQPRLGAKNPRRQKFCKKLYVSQNRQRVACMVRSIQIARSESEKAEEDRDQATKEQRYTKRNATPRRVFW